MLDCAYVGVPSWAQRAGRFQPTGPLEFQKRTRDVGHRLRKKGQSVFYKIPGLSKTITLEYIVVRFFPVFFRIPQKKNYYRYFASVFLGIPDYRIPV